MDEIKKVVVIGSGIMGHGIAEVFALSGYSVILEDVIPESLSRARASIEKSLARMLASGKLDQGKKDRTMQLIGYSQNLAESARDADLII